MTIAELNHKTDEELDMFFSSMPEPSHRKAINTEVAHSLDQIIHSFSESKVSRKDREALQNDLVNLA